MFRDRPIFQPDKANDTRMTIPTFRLASLFVISALYGALMGCTPPADQAPEIRNPGDQQTRAGRLVELPLQASDPEGEPITFDAEGLPEGLTLHQTNATITGTPLEEGDNTVTLKARDNHNNETSAKFHWIVEPNHPPRVEVETTQKYRVKDEVRLKINATDPDGDSLTFGADRLPKGLSLDAESGLISGKTETTGELETLVIVSDGLNKVSSKISWTITPNTPPQINGPQQVTVSVGENVDVAIDASDADGDTLSYAAQDLPPGLSLDPHTGRISGTPTTEAPLVQSVIIVTDSFGDHTSLNLSWEVKAAGLAGLIARWQFEEGSGQIAHDSSGNGNNGEFRDNLGNTVEGGWGTGDFAGTLSMDGGDDGIVVVPMSDSIRAIRDKVTVMAWTYRTERHNVAVMAHDYSNSLFFGYHEYHQDKKDPTKFTGAVFKWDIHNDKGENAACWTPTSALENQPVNRWYHLTGVYDGQNAILYVDGQEICRAPLTGNLLITDKPITLSGFLNGGWGPALTDEITGNLDDVRLYDRALSPQEINTIYSQTKKN